MKLVKKGWEARHLTALGFVSSIFLFLSIYHGHIVWLNEQLKKVDEITSFLAFFIPAMIALASILISNREATKRIQEQRKVDDIDRLKSRLFEIETRASLEIRTYIMSEVGEYTYKIYAETATALESKIRRAARVLDKYLGPLEGKQTRYDILYLAALGGLSNAVMENVDALLGPDKKVIKKRYEWSMDIKKVISDYEEELDRLIIP